MAFGRKKVTTEEHPTIARVDALLRHAIEHGASDLHVGPLAGEEGRGLARVRVDGFFRKVETLEAAELPRVVARLKVLAGLPAFRTTEPMDGALRIASSGTSIDARLATVPVVGGESAVVRFLCAGAGRGLDDLGLADATRARIGDLLAQPDGAIVVVGPCSSGKSTTLRAMARLLVAERGDHAHVASAEDPVEESVPGVTQVEVDAARGLGFPAALAALLRQDPQVLLVGEMRDPETARIGVEAALTGHLLLTSLHVARIDDVPRRLELLGVPAALVASALRGVVNQRLMRMSCAACSGVGTACEPCAGTGHRGRFAVAEVAAVEGGRARLVTPSLDDAARAAVVRGTTSERERARVFDGGRAS